MNLWGKREQNRLVSQQRHEKNLASQLRMSPHTVAALHRKGVLPGSALRLEYFFYAQTQSSGEALMAALQARGYSAECRSSADGSGSFCITGWTDPIAILDGPVVKWTSEMCELGFENGAEFDGWGTTTGQTEPLE